MTVELPNSGGIQTTSDVYLRGARIGTVDSIQVHPDHVAAKVTIEDGHKINRNSIVRASGLSAAGEQFLDFRPTTSDGPYFRNGDIVPKSQASVAIPFPKMLETTLKVVDQIDPAKLSRTI